MYRVVLVVILLALSVWAPASAKPLIVKLGTLAPEGSIWHDALLQVRQKWHSISDGELEIRIYGGGVLGGEAEMVRKLQRRSLDAVAITGAGLPHVDRSVDILNVPVLFESYAELEHVRGRIAAKLEQRMEKRGFKVLSWSDAGWVYFFTKSPVRIPDDLRRLRLRITESAPEGEKLFKEFRFRVVPLPATDTLTGLQTGLIEAIDVPPLFALLDRSYQLAKYMTDLRWAPLNAATVISMRTWKRIPHRYHDALLAAIRDVARTTQAEIRSAGDRAIAEMQARGLKVVRLDGAERAQWRREARAAYPALRANIGLPILFDEVLSLAETFKKKHLSQAGADTTAQP